MEYLLGQSIVQDVNLNSFYPEAYTFIRGLERTLSTQGGHSECCRKNAGDYMGFQRKERFCMI